uniref:Uncharacterized protein n=1 Tax=Romanomermis culicivorax TaxID=13658 RepID=A0A915IK78_ROMCU
MDSLSREFLRDFAKEKPFFVENIFMMDYRITRQKPTFGKHFYRIIQEKHEKIDSTKKPKFLHKKLYRKLYREED